MTRLKRNYINRRRGLSMTELLISVIILFFIMMGVAAIDQAIKRAHTTSTRGSNVTMQLSAAMMHISNNVILAVGNRTSPGVIVNPPGASWELVMRQDDDGTPWDYSDDKGVRYVNAADGRLQVCMDWTWPAGPCNNPSVNQYDVARNIFYEASYVQYDFVTDAPNRDLYLEVSLRARSNVNASVPVDPIKNPQVTQTTRIHMPGHTWSDSP